MKSWVRGAAQRVRQPELGLPPLDYGVNVARLYASTPSVC